MARVKDVMTRDVVSARESTPFKDVAGLLQDHEISAIPVVDDEGKLVGIVSESDLLLKEEDQLRERPARLIEGKRRRTERRKAWGSVACDVMTSPVVTIGPDSTVSDAARLMHAKRVKRLPVVGKDGRIIGIVSRADLLKVFLRTDEDIEREIVDRVILGLEIEPGAVQVEVHRGVVELHGRPELASISVALAEQVRGVDGVVDVDEDLGFVEDDMVPYPETYGPWGVAMTPQRH